MTNPDFAKKIAPDDLIEVDEANEHGGNLTPATLPGPTILGCLTVACVPTLMCPPTGA